MNERNFEDWMKKLRDYAISKRMNEANGFDSYMHPDNWAEYFEQGWDADEALDKELSYMD